MPAQLIAGVIAYLLAVATISLLIVIRPIGTSRRWRPVRLRTRLLVGAAVFLVLLPAVLPAFPFGATELAGAGQRAGWRGAE
ncbi:MAG: hypothetical protein E6J42_02480 [Chloroflexi bacterium]|nr:MAG: hypothetical protein E6J42_02480 [Chloroflexota bacterium]